MSRDGILTELKKRRVYRAAVLYVIVALAIWQAADIAVPALDLPSAVMHFIVAGAIVGFPIALAVAWVFDLHIIRARSSDGGGDARSGRHANGKPRPRRDRFIVLLSSVVLLFVSLALAAVLFRSTESDVPPPPQPVPLPVELVSAKGVVGRDSVLAVIRDEEGYVRSWIAATTSAPSSVDRPTVDFGRDMILFVAMPQYAENDRIVVDSVFVRSEATQRRAREEMLMVHLRVMRTCENPVEESHIVTMARTRRFDGPVRWNFVLVDGCPSDR